ALVGRALGKDSSMPGAEQTLGIRPLVIGGESVVTDRIEDVTSPYDGSVIARVCLAGEAELERAVLSAQQAFETTRVMPRHATRRILRGVADRIRAGREAAAR